MDVVGFGHIDAYVNAWTYRAMRNANALFDALGDAALAGQCRRLAAGVRAAYARELVNPATGWVAGWKSRDGELHDVPMGQLHAALRQDGVYLTDIPTVDDER